MRKLRQSTTRWFLVLLLAFLIGLGIQLTAPQQVTAQSNSAVRSELTSLRSRVSRLESAIRSLGSGARTSPSRSNPLADGDELSISETDPRFKRLATLVVDLREQVTDLETRVIQLEKRTVTPGR